VTVYREHNVKRANQQDSTNSMFIIKLSISTCFGHHYAHHQEKKTVDIESLIINIELVESCWFSLFTLQGKMLHI